jgi:hypothetical protein
MEESCVSVSFGAIEWFERRLESATERERPSRINFIEKSAFDYCNQSVVSDAAVQKRVGTTGRKGQ